MCLHAEQEGKNRTRTDARVLEPELQNQTKDRQDDQQTKHKTEGEQMGPQDRSAGVCTTPKVQHAGEEHTQNAKQTRTHIQRQRGAMLKGYAGAFGFPRTRLKLKKDARPEEKQNKLASPREMKNGPLGRQRKGSRSSDDY